MATTNDIDTKSAVRKFLERRSVVDKEDKSADQSDEIQSILESIALTFLINPQAALSFILRSKNKLQQVVLSDLEIIDFLLKTINEIDNPDEQITDHSDLIEAQTALIEVDRVGRVGADLRSFKRYNDSINRFLDSVLSKTLKRRQRGEFERTGSEAREDLFNVLSMFNDTHSSLISSLGNTLAGVENFRGVDLTKIVSSKVLSKVRSSIKKVIRGIETTQLSGTSVAIELLAGASALNSVSDSRDIYDPTIETDEFPTGRTLSAYSENVAAVAIGNNTSANMSGIATPWIFNITTDPLIGGGTNYSITLPHTGASNRHFVKASSGSATYNISASNRTLHVRFDGITPPAGEAVMVRSVQLSTGGAVSITTILSELNNVVTGLINGTAVQIGNTGRILIYGSSSVTGITILNEIPGTYSVGVYTPGAGSVHTTLGFVDQQKSSPPNTFLLSDAVDFLSVYVPSASFSIEEERMVIRSNSTEPLSSLSFGSGVADKFGFSGSYESEPTYLEIKEDCQALLPSDLGIFTGSVVIVSDAADTSRSLFSDVLEINGTQLIFDSNLSLPRGNGMRIKVLSPLVFQVQSLFDKVRPMRSNFDSDFIDLQEVLTPLLSNPTLAQINDAKEVIKEIKSKVEDLLTELESVSVRFDQMEFHRVAELVSSTLRDRGLDRALELLESSKFLEFFSITGETASKSSRLLKSTEEVGRNELLTTTIEQDIKDLESKADTPDDILTGVELMEDEEQL